MMESIHVLEPAFQISAVPLHRNGTGWNDVPRAANLLARAEKRASGLAGRLALSLLDRLNIFSAPRIISAECLFTDTSTTAGDCR